LKKNKKIAMDFLQEGLCDSTKGKVGKSSSTKELWNKLHNIYSKGSHLIIETKHTNQNKEDARTEQEERCSSC
jgi:hypothetical protein